MPDGSAPPGISAARLNQFACSGIQAGKMTPASIPSGNAMSPALVAGTNDLDDVRAAASGDRAAFQRLYRQHADRIYGAMLRLAGFDHARAEDLTQDAFVRAWQKLDSFREQSAFGTWLYRLAVNVALMDIRARGADRSASSITMYCPIRARRHFAPRNAMNLSVRSVVCRRVHVQCWCCTTSKAGGTRTSRLNWVWAVDRRKHSYTVLAACCAKH